MCKILFLLPFMFFLCSCSTIGKAVNTTINTAVLAVAAPIDLALNGKDAEILLSKKEREKRRLERAIRSKKKREDNAKMVFNRLKENRNSYGKQPTFVVEAPREIHENIHYYIHNKIKGIVRNESRREFLKPQYRFLAKVKSKKRMSSKRKIFYTYRLLLQIKDEDEDEILFAINYSAGPLVKDKKILFKHIDKALYSFFDCEKVKCV